MTSSSEPPVDVIIVGAGPTGLTLAYELLRRGVKPRIVEKATVPSDNTRALGVMARTLEVLAPSGITEQMLALGVRVPTFSIWSSGRQIAHLDFARGMETPFPYMLMLPQHATEAILTDHIVRHGGSIERGVELIGLTQQADGVDLVLRHAGDTEERLRSSYLVGCDGAHSTVRRLMGTPFTGTTVAQQFLTGDVRMDWDLSGDQAVAYMNRGHIIAYFPLPDGQHRFLSASPPGEASSSDVAREEIQRIVDLCGSESGAAVIDAKWVARYQVQRRMAKRFVDRRVVLAGDAAHVHSPLGAQGMNMGIQDAMNLGWKLALVVQQRAPARLLETYHVERAGVSSLMLRQDAVLTRLASLRHPLAGAIADRVASRLSRQPHLHRYITWTAAGFRISYDRGPLRAEYHGEKPRLRAFGVKAGSRAPNGPLFATQQDKPIQLYELLSGTGLSLLAFTSHPDAERWCELRSALAGWHDLLELHPILLSDPPCAADPARRPWHDPAGALAARYGIQDEGLVLIRPDGYIGFRGRPIAVEPLLRYLHTHFLRVWS